MLKRSNTVRAIATFVLSLSGVVAFTMDLLGEPAPIDRPANMMQVIDSIAVYPLSPIEEALLYPKRLIPLPPGKIDSETLWLARAIFSESKRPEEQVLVAWVVRNRVETRYRGKRSYEDVVTDPYQFSAFRKQSQKRPFYSTLDATSRVPGWNRALRIAYDIRHVDSEHRPFSIRTRHFYSERSMSRGRHPAWVSGREPVEIDLVMDIDQTRFRFYEDIS